MNVKYFRFKKTMMAVLLPIALAQYSLANADDQVTKNSSSTSNPTDVQDVTSIQSINSATNQTLNLDEVVVTGTSEAGSKMRKSEAVSTLSIEQIMNNQPQNAADVLSSIPGIHVESSGGAGNANVTVRGIPISAGGSRYVQFQEDGLPVLLFGDIAFGTPDTFMRVDGGLDHVEAVRGGAASTMATNAPGGIINFISKTGEDQGGNVMMTTGVGYDLNRFDFDYGKKISDSTRMFFGGYYNLGQGPRDNPSNAIQGGQIRANITHDLDNGSYIRVSFKHLDDQMPLFMPTPVNINNGQISTIPGFDPRKYTGYSAYWVPDLTLTRNNGTLSSNINNGQTALSDALGFEGSFNLSNGWNVTNRFRHENNSGQFIGLFPGSTLGPAAAGTTFVNGPQAGQAYTGQAFQNVVFNTTLNNLGATTDDLRAAKTFKLNNGSKLTTTAGLFLNQQNVDLTWNFNNYLMQATGVNPALLKNSTTNSSGLIGPAFGGCCSRDINATYRTTSPYANLTWETGPLTLDGSVRSDHQNASGYYNQATGTPLTYVGSNSQAVNYSVSHTEYSIGANYLITDRLATFLRISDGASFNADRIMFSGPLNGTTAIPINTVKQYEGGFKIKSGNLSSFITFFDAKTNESNYDATTQLNTQNQYDARGVEIEEGYHLGHFRITGGLTYTDATTTTSNIAALVGTMPNRLAHWVYQVGPGYGNDKFDIGADIVGTSSSLDAQGIANTAPVTLPAYTIVNLHANYNFDKQTKVILGVYNAFNTLAFTEADNGYAARALNGQVINASLRYSFK